MFLTRPLFSETQDAYKHRPRAGHKTPAQQPVTSEQERMGLGWADPSICRNSKQDMTSLFHENAKNAIEARKNNPAFSNPKKYLGAPPGYSGLVPYTISQNIIGCSDRKAKMTAHEYDMRFSRTANTGQSHPNYERVTQDYKYFDLVVGQKLASKNSISEVVSSRDLPLGATDQLDIANVTELLDDIIEQVKEQNDEVNDAIAGNLDTLANLELNDEIPDGEAGGVDHGY